MTGTIVRDTTRTVATSELIMSYSQVISLLNLFGVDTAGAESVDLRVWRENDTFLALGDNGKLMETDSVNFSFKEVSTQIDQQTLNIIGVDFSPPI